MPTAPDTAPAPARTRRPPPAYLFALGHGGLPDQLVTPAATFRFLELFKHDFFAATGLYEVIAPPERRGQRAVLKIQRTYPLLGFPLRWLGRRVARHEISIYEKLQGVPGIPAFLGRVGPTGFLHAFIPGVDLHSDLPLAPHFFQQLQQLFQDLHDRRIAYVDANKRENILYGDDGRPWLIDFQISYDGNPRFGWNPFRQWMFRRFERADWYHFYKHKTRLLPLRCSPEDFCRARRRGWLHALHRRIARPVIRVRRYFLSRYRFEKVR